VVDAVDRDERRHRAVRRERVGVLGVPEQQLDRGRDLDRRLHRLPPLHEDDASDGSAFGDGDVHEVGDVVLGRRDDTLRHGIDRHDRDRHPGDAVTDPAARLRVDPALDGELRPGQRREVPVERLECVEAHRHRLRVAAGDAAGLDDRHVVGEERNIVAGDQAQDRRRLAGVGLGREQQDLTVLDDGRAVQQRVALRSEDEPQERLDDVRVQDMGRPAQERVGPNDDRPAERDVEVGPERAELLAMGDAGRRPARGRVEVRGDRREAAPDDQVGLLDGVDLEVGELPERNDRLEADDPLDVVGVNRHGATSSSRSAAARTRVVATGRRQIQRSEIM
jgi:hypothetical protein